MKIRLLNAGLCVCALLTMLSGCSSDETLTGDTNTAVQSMKINVSDGMFTSLDNNGAKTRATDNGTATSFSSSDVIGIFAVKSDGTVALTNAKYTYDGTSKWLNSNNTENLPYYEGARYFAYYPYQENMDGKYSASGTFSDLTAEKFFGTFISGWTPATDQSTQAKYTAQDLMVSLATVNTSTYSSLFVMSHQMSMVEMDLNQVHYTYNGADAYRFTFGAASKPFNIAAGKYRLLVNPSAALSVTGDNLCSGRYDGSFMKGLKISGTAPAAAKYKIYKYKGASASLVQTARRNVCIGDTKIGDYLYDDGTTGTTTVGKTIVGIVFSNQVSPGEYLAGYTHGYALALTDASNGTSWGPYPGEAGLTHIKNFAESYQDIDAGYYGTFTLKYNKSNGSYPAWQSANNYNVDVSKFTNSGWFLPSIGQWWDVCTNLGKVDLSGQWTAMTEIGNEDLYHGSIATANVNNAIIAAGGTALTITPEYYYWSATECDPGYAAIVNFTDSRVYLNWCSAQYGGWYVRAVLAF